jgi:hypothetical protein
MSATQATRAKEKILPTPKSLMKSGGLATTNISAVKKESQLIAKNPKRFLNSFLEGKISPKSSSLTTLLANVELDFSQSYYPQTSKSNSKSSRTDAELMAKVNKQKI